MNDINDPPPDYKPPHADYWYPWFPRRYIHDTRALGLAADGAYRRLIDEYMLTRLTLPDDDHALARICGIGVEEWLAVASQVRPFFTKAKGRLCNKRCESELRKQDLLQKRNIEKARRGGIAKSNKLKDLNATSMLQAYSKHATSMPGACPEPATYYKERDLPLTSEQGAAREAASNEKAVESDAVPFEDEPPSKRPDETSRAELEAIFAARRARVNGAAVEKPADEPLDEPPPAVLGSPPS